MKETFSAYSNYYDLMYENKDYKNEYLFVKESLDRHQTQARNILDLGCGTGRFTRFFAQEGFEVCGLDLSESMLAIAEKNFPKISFTQGDIRSFSLGKTFDRIVSLFHVISYLSTNDDVIQTFRRVRDHLSEGGVFAFDCWHGPTVLSEKPTVKIKRVENERIQVTRFAEPILRDNENLVEVHYHVFVKEKASGFVTEIREKHVMRYFFPLEIELLCSLTDLSLVGSRGWLSQNPPSLDNWGALYVLSK